jgi:hypothetical protein
MVVVSWLHHHGDAMDIWWMVVASWLRHSGDAINIWWMVICKPLILFNLTQHI